MSLPLATEIEEGMEIVSPPKPALNLGFGARGIKPLKTFKPKVPIPSASGSKTPKIDLSSNTAFPALNPSPTAPSTPVLANGGAGGGAAAGSVTASPVASGSGLQPATPATVKKASFARLGSNTPGKTKPTAGKVIKRKVVDDDEYKDDGKTYTDTFWDTWNQVTPVVSKMGETVKKYKADNPNCPTGSVLEENFHAVEKVFTLVGNMNQSFANKMDYDRSRVSSVKKVVDTNVSCGNITTKIEGADDYNTIKGRMKLSARQTKVIGLDFGQKISTRDGIITKAKELLCQNSEVKKLLNKGGVAFFPLGSESKVYNGVHTLPILIRVSDHKERSKLDFALRNAQRKVAQHWPVEIKDHITHIRSCYEKFKDDDKKIDLTKCYILLRPNHDTGATISVQYKEKNAKGWVFLENIKTPASMALIDEFDEEQPTVSNFVSFG